MNRCHIGLVILLSLCVFIQMLGVPAPLLDAGGSFDISESSIQEGWSIHARYVFPPPRARFTSRVVAEPILNVPILARGLFRPPLG